MNIEELEKLAKASPVVAFQGEGESGRYYNAASPDDILTLINMLKQTEDAYSKLEVECLSQARLDGMGSEREAALLARLAEAEKREAILQAQLKEATGALMYITYCGNDNLGNPENAARFALSKLSVSK